MDRVCVKSVEAEYRRYKAIAEAALGQLRSDELGASVGAMNSPATLAWHISGNLKSRFTDFLTTDGEKPWRDRESEFAPHLEERSVVLARWEEGWHVLFATLGTLSDVDLPSTVTIRGVSLTVQEALHRSLAHASYHVGQIVLIAKGFRDDSWEYLSIPPGGSESYNRDPTFEKPSTHARRVADK